LAKINQDLIERLAEKLGVTDRAVYPHITKVANETKLERNLAALELATRHHININRFSTKDERDELRHAFRGGGDRVPEREYRPAEPARRRSAPTKKKAAKRTKSNTVFVVHGRDNELRKSMFEFLRALKLHPLEWDHAIAEAKQGNPYVGEVLKVVMESAEAIIVLFSPDDLAQLKEHFCSPSERSTEGKPQGQARPNVLFEAGLALGAHPDKTIMVQVGKVKPFSDIGGRHMMRLTDDTASRNSFANRLAQICDVDKVGNDWMTAGTFEPTELAPAKKRATKRAK
jgi:predicted nucleotide-binding protein